MRKDIDKLMKKMKIDAIYAVGKSSKDATMYYLLFEMRRQQRPQNFLIDRLNHLVFQNYHAPTR